MPDRDWRLRLYDIAESLDAIEGYVAGRTFESFGEDRRTVDAVVRNLEIVGEAANALPREFRDRNLEIPWDDVRAMRNILVHAYFRVDLGIVWKTATVFGPQLLVQVRRLIGDEGGPNGNKA